MFLHGQHGCFLEKQQSMQGSIIILLIETWKYSVTEKMKMNIKICTKYFLCKRIDIALDICSLLNLRLPFQEENIYVYIKGGELQFFIIFRIFKSSNFKDFQQNFFFFQLEIGREGRLRKQGIFIKLEIFSFIFSFFTLVY